MGERYDVVTTLGDGVFPLVALAEGKDATALALVRTGAGNRHRLRSDPPNSTVTASATTGSPPLRICGCPPRPRTSRTPWISPAAL